MKVTLTAKLKLRHTPEQKAALDAVTLAFRDALNFASEVAFRENKLSAGMRLQKLVYNELRERMGLPSQMACNAPRQVAATYKGLWTKLKKHNEREAKLCAEKPRRKFRPFKGFEAPARFASRTLTYNFGRDFSWKKGQQVSIQTLDGRQVMAYEGYQKHLDFIAQGCEVGAAKLYYQKSKKQYYLLVSLEVELPDPQPEDHTRVVGVDVGQRYHAVVTDTQQHSKFFSGKAVNQKKDRFARVRKSLQRKGTRSATRRLVEFSGRERRFIADRNHSLASQILKLYPHAFIGLENLKDIRTRTEGRSNPKASKKAKRAKRRRSQWSFAELQTFLAYKAPLVGSMAVKVDANYTSQACTRCGYTSRDNRPEKGLMFVCRGCGYQVHADLLGSRNVALRTLVIRQDWMATGHLSVAPDVADVEAKAARLQRYAELRWSPATSPRL
ncbi:RNA-guided endonuclease TnpB family protein [Deinococcus sp. S9]|uniref:RNA-guided endonuclease InsQ/TnpB family protein n=1 Tax=Deinococcus sp. S9 TaxID=2545754 RepID=UPI0010544AB4|nr:RNA-guided endonuclease TnpB family protein [Deinococcus sp. S9]TDE87385.1 transposase [Deinococcus sp. S9]